MASADLVRLTRVLARLLARSEADVRAAFTPAVAADLPSLLQLRQSVLGRELVWNDEAYLRWRYFAPPELTAPANVLWVYRDPAGAVVGSLGVEPLALHVGAERVVAHRFMDVMVEPRMNGLGLGAWMNLELHERYDVGLAVGATKDSYNLVRRVFHPLPERRSWKTLIRSEDFLARHVPRLSRVPGVRRAADSALAIARRGWRHRPRGIRIEAVSALDPGAVAALDASMAAAGHTFSERSADYLTWRYLRNPRRRYRIWQARREGRVVGLLVGRTLERRGELVDWLWDAGAPEPQRSENLRALFRHAIEELAEDTVLTVWTRTLGSFGEQIAADCGLALRQDRDTVAVQARSPARRAQLLSARWFLTLGDSDDD